jgi:hypothetical protein
MTLAAENTCLVVGRNVFSEQILENTEWVITEKTGNIPMMRKNVTKHTTQYMFDTSKSNQTQIT